MDAYQARHNIQQIDNTLGDIEQCGCGAGEACTNVARLGSGTRVHDERTVLVQCSAVPPVPYRT